MVLGPADPGPAAIEVLTGSPYGLSLHGPDLPVFRPAGWTPEIGIAAALDLLGWTCERTSGSVDEAVARIARATPTDPVVTGPFEMGCCRITPAWGRRSAPSTISWSSGWRATSSGCTTRAGSLTRRCRWTPCCRWS
ncbi:hypothetical protein [Salinispora arenicola]|uniref:hypothetical protein n=1 Tax=Salinispora arenicola TaxID=168697 RepID=UPI001E333458|nr:hypothetical protein [Salinispora arenicola]